MFRKLNTKTLAITLVALTAIMVIVLTLDEKKGGRTIREELVRLDSAAVNIIRLYPQSDNHAEIMFFKDGNTWKVQKEKVTASADTNAIRSIINTFKLITPQRLATSEKNRWKEYSTDDSIGTRIKFYSNETLLADIVVGKFSYNNDTRSGISYLRLYDEENVYATEGFIPMTVNQPFNQWRNKHVFKGEKNSFSKLSFLYANGDAFALTKENNKWKIGTAFTDSAKTEQYLSAISSVNSTSFADDYKETSPVITLKIEGSNINHELKAFPAADSANGMTIHSSYNPEAYFHARQDKLDETFFKSKDYFLSKTPSKKTTKGKS